ncbi:hypothetical protein MKZ38_002229 [Zalerion maritima]|uniref:DNA replication complex GINS protein SLD5 n=1 Tax=Zalerion maritima TaxID=339359 RepID=A0AAD5RVZ6_9PEZI|nr:hypothetical protein MKZ38_002229 [Zalerion maritima]
MDIDDILKEVDPTFNTIPPETRDLQALTRAWVAERSTPELLEWPPDNLFERISNRIKAQIEKIEDMTGDMDPRTNFALIVIQTELERYKFLMRSFLRSRMAKHQALLHNHYLSSFLSAFPPALQNLNDTAGNISMIDQPDNEGAVFVRLLRGTMVTGRGVDADGSYEGQEGHILILRWSDAKGIVARGDAEVV